MRLKGSLTGLDSGYALGRRAGGASFYFLLRPWASQGHAAPDCRQAPQCSIRVSFHAAENPATSLA